MVYVRTSLAHQSEQDGLPEADAPLCSTVQHAYIRLRRCGDVDLQLYCKFVASNLRTYSRYVRIFNNLSVWSLKQVEVVASVGPADIWSI